MPHASRFLLAALVAACLLLPQPAFAATVNYGSGTFDYVMGNDGVAGGGNGTPPNNNANASGNTVNLTGGTVSAGIYGGIHWNTTGNAAANNNRVTSTPSFAGGASLSVYGGLAQPVSGATGSAVADGNSVDLSGGAFNTIYGGTAIGETGAATAGNNTVTLTNVNASGVTGGTANVNGITTATATANNNEVTVTDSTLSGDVTGGRSGTHFRDAAYHFNNDNRVTLAGTTDVTGNVHGGDVFGDARAYNGATGNTLNIVNPKSGGITVGGNVQYFQNYNFYIPSTMAAGGTMLSVTGTAYINDATVNVGIEGSSSPLLVGDTVTLISAGTLDGTPANTSTSGQGMQGLAKRFTFDIYTSADDLLARVTSTGANEQLKSMVESRVAGLGMLTQGADMLAAQGIPQLKANAMGASGPAAFATMGGSSLRYDSGSHVDVDGFNAIAGLGWNVALNEGKSGNLLLGAFFETGWGSYDSHNSFSNAASVNGDGDTHYYGGGILGRYDSAPVGPGSFYLEASGRAGRVKTDYDSSDFDSATGEDVDFDSSSTYYGAHAGLGYIWNITDKANLDLYTKYLWTHQDSDSVTIQGDRIQFKSMDSHRWRGGARFGYDVTTDQGSTLTPYIGAAYEYEFDSKARASANGDSIDAPDVKGSTGIGELGLSFKAANTGLSVDLGIQGYTGKREGVGGGFQLKWEF